VIYRQGFWTLSLASFAPLREIEHFRVLLQAVPEDCYYGLVSTPFKRQS
jgi:hypothetical protein